MEEKMGQPAYVGMTAIDDENSEVDSEGIHPVARSGQGFLDVIEKPSQVTPSVVATHCQSSSVLSFRIYMDLVQMFASDVGEETHLQGGAGLMEILRLCDRRSLDESPSLPPRLQAGLFAENYGAADRLSLYSGSLCASLASFCPTVGGRSARWLHRIPERSGGEVDVQLCVVAGNSTIWVPVMVMEVGLLGTKDGKHAQASAHAVNVSSQMGTADVLLLAELMVHPAGSEAFGWLTVTGCHFGTNGQLARVLLCAESLSAVSFEHLLRACDMVVQWNTTPSVEHAWQTVSDNVAASHGKIYKVFDYREQDVPEDGRRQAALSLAFIPGCVKVFECQDLVVISYPIVAGTNTPTSVGHFISLIDVVLCLHKKGVIHGDIRASNVIFGAKGAATLIDFDLSGDEKRKYPIGFNPDIEDGKRANDATGGRNLSWSHDWEALAGLMGMTDGPDQMAWSSAIGAVEQGRLEDASKLLEQHRGQPLHFRIER